MRQNRAEIKREDWHISDQRYYVSDSSKFTEFTGWTPQIHLKEGLSQLMTWIQREAQCK
jgi:nucleoside-diphosphate-sugar epimerase